MKKFAGDFLHKYCMFDPWKQSKLIQAYTGAKSVALPQTQEIDNLDDLKKLAGVDKISESPFGAVAANKLQIARDRNIRTGTDEWFRLNFAKPHLTGEQPYDEK